MRAEEALINLEQFLDDSVRAGPKPSKGYTWKKGTGALRQAREINGQKSSFS
ncbi:MAG: hypothetical protein CM1200mP3_03660 [Chloroflexota bacterium]|nr:MAG: hypothetical protein CM1200mP3_03660 [Chloroflexota bacterium]